MQKRVVLSIFMVVVIALLLSFIISPDRGVFYMKARAAVANEKEMKTSKSGSATLSDAEYVPGEILIKFKNPKNVKSTYPGKISALSDRIVATLTVQETFRNTGIARVKVPAGVKVEDLIERISRDPEVEYAEPNYICKITATPDDPYFSNQWGLHNTGQLGGTDDADVDAVEGWDQTTDGTGVIVAVIDTGVDYTHEDLKDNMWKNTGEDWNPDGTPGNDEIDNDGNGYVDDYYGINAIDNSGDPMDDHNHGTHCAGIIAAVGNNGVGVSGICWSAQIMALKFIASGGTGSTSDAIECIEYGIAQGVDVMSNSWGSSNYSQSLQDAVDQAEDAGILFLAAAGNFSADNDTQPFYPANLENDNVISVAATDQNDSIASFSNYGLYTVDVAAPGDAIYSTVIGDSYSYMGGTSMACPLVSGIAALLMTSNPGLTHYQVKGRILRTVDPLGDLDGAILTGGRVNLDSCLKSSAEPCIFKVSPEVFSGGDTVTITGVNFGSSRGSKVVFPGGDYASSYTSWTDTEIVCTAPDNAQSGDVQVVTSTSSSNTVPVHVQKYSYTYNDKEEYSWVETDSPQEADIEDSDQGEQIDIGFTFPFYENTYSKVTVSSNGYLTFGSSGAERLNASIPSQDDPNNIIAVYWDDLDPSLGGDIYYQVDGEEPYRRLIISWQDIPHNTASGVGTFQVILHESTGQIVFQYKDVDFDSDPYSNGNNATVGVEDSSGAAGTLYSYNSSRLSDELAVKWTCSGMPQKPVNLAAEATSSQVDLTWEDTASNEEGFVIQRRDDQSSFSRLATVGSNVTSYSDTDVEPDTTYYYRVKSYNGNYSSNYSDEVSAKTEGDDDDGGSSGSTSGGSGGGGCFIATAAYGTPMASEVRTLCQIRDQYLVPNPVGKTFTKMYYKFSPPLARAIRNNDRARAGVRLILYPVIAVCRAFLKYSVDPFLAPFIILTFVLILLSVRRFMNRSSLGGKPTLAKKNKK